MEFTDYEKRRLCGAIATILSEDIDGVSVSVVSSRDWLFALSCERGADLSLLDSFGIVLRDDRSWDSSSRNYSFTLSADSFGKILRYVVPNN